MTIRSITNGSRFFTLLANRVNGLRNPDFLDVPPAEPDPQFAHFVELVIELSTVGVFDLVGDTQKKVAFNAFFNGYAPQYSHKVVEFLGLLDLPMPGKMMPRTSSSLSILRLKQEICGASRSPRVQHLT